MEPSLKSLAFLSLGIFSATADTTFNNTDKYAWASNTGWISLRHDQPASPEGVVFGESFLSGTAYAANTGWIDFGDGTPANGHTYSNDASDHGVNHDGAGNLTGFAWSANTGWINFGWAGASDPNRPRVDLVTGAFSGYAWSSNTGWINLGSGILIASSMTCPDSDGDGMADHWEWENFGGLGIATGQTDTDGDGVLDKDEYNADTDPNNPGSFFEIISMTFNNSLTKNTIIFSSSASRLYRIEYDDNLGVSPSGDWTTSPLGIFSPDPGPTTKKVVTFPTGDTNFFRIEAIRPLTPGP